MLGLQLKHILPSIYRKVPNGWWKGADDHISTERMNKLTKNPKELELLNLVPSLHTRLKKREHERGRGTSTMAVYNKVYLQIGSVQ
jgi:hypothetical protein